MVLISIYQMCSMIKYIRGARGLEARGCEGREGHGGARLEGSRVGVNHRSGDIRDLDLTNHPHVTPRYLSLGCKNKHGRQPSSDL